MSDFLFECFSEEIPARMQLAAAQQLTQKLEKALTEAQLTFDSLAHFVSPRHLAIIVRGLPERQPDQTIERKGPKVSAPDAALDGFLRSAGVSKDQLEIRGEGKDACYFTLTHTKGAPTKDVLKKTLEEILKEFHWPKSQRWGPYPISWVRPLQNLCSLFGSEIVPITFGHLTANNITYGHRFLAPEAIILSSPADYLPALKKVKVIVDREERKTLITQRLMTKAAEHGLTLIEDEALLEEVTGLVEWPKILCGAFDESFLTLPPEVLISEMRHHQKYFALKAANGSLSQHFLFVANMTCADDGVAIIHGNQRVLRARLSDGAFFWKTDRDRPLSQWATGLSGVIFHAKLGSLTEKVSRVSALSQHLLPMIADKDSALVIRAAALCKADLVSGMVGEFPDLQGIMGRYYALAQGETPEIADAIRDHYKPIGAADDVPTEPISIALALADKIDSLVGLFAVGDRPTGSKDPYALRRAALGIIRTILANNLRIPLREILHVATQQIPKNLVATSYEETQEALFQFFCDRLKVILKDSGLRHDIISAAMHDPQEQDLIRIRAKAIALQEFLNTEAGENLLAAYRRANNLVSAEEKKSNANFSDLPQDALFEQEEECALFTALIGVQAHLKKALQSEDYSGAIGALASLRSSVDAYFSAVMVNVEDAKIRKNRLCTLYHIRARMDNIVNFALIEGTSS